MDISNMKMIGSGAEADIYLLGNKAIKVFKNVRLQADACYEAELQSKAHKAGLPVPAIYEVSEINGKAAIIMEYVKGKTIRGMDYCNYYKI